MSKTTTHITKPSVLNTTAAFSTMSSETTSTEATSITAFTKTLSPTSMVTTSPFSTSTKACVCRVNGTEYSPGDQIYNVHDSIGFCFIAHCNASCMVEVESRDCSTPIPTTILTTPRGTVSTTSPYTSSVTPATTLLDCTDVSPPRKNGESWEVGNCTTAKCINGVVTTAPISCPPHSPPFCANGHQPAKIYDQKGCCYDYECPCVCSVWNKKNYLTFDGKYYQFAENCSYYLVKEIISKYNLTISMTKEACDYSGDDTFCSQTLTVDYQSHVVVFKQLKISEGVQIQIYVNGQQVYPPYKNTEILITGTDIVLSLKITAINTTVIYSGSLISIDLPQSLFGKNTEGQCGTCDNSQSNDCRSPNGQVQNCSISARQWMVPGEKCVQPTLPPFPPPIITDCIRDICDILTSSVFKECHKVVPVDFFHQSCLEDVCENPNNNCTSLEAYATECTNAGVCLNWRNQTKGLCEHKCPGEKVYKACGPEVTPTCNNRYNDKYKADNDTAFEGCFCPNGTTVFNKVYPICVSTCDVCVGPDGKPREPGDTWTSGCNLCVCDKDSLSTRCIPVQCPTEGAVNCSEPGQQIVNQTNTCCTQQICECNVSLCPKRPTCPLGFTMNVTDGVCCQEYQCVPKGVCIYDQKEYQPGEKIPITPATAEPPLEAPLNTSEAPSARASPTQNQSPCQECYCGPNVDPNTSLHIIVCTPVVCNISCSEGYDYQKLSGQCCGHCVQTQCIVSIDNSTVAIKPNQTFVSPTNKCMKYSCEKVNDQYVTTQSTKVCPPFNTLDCDPGTETTDADGCCKSCTLRSVCEVRLEPKVIEVNGCKSKQPVNMTYCTGHCGSTSVYSAAANSFQRNCDCCQETNTTQEQVALTCTDGSTHQHTYSLATACACTPSNCSEPSRRRRRR